MIRTLWGGPHHLLQDSWFFLSLNMVLSDYGLMFVFVTVLQNESGNNQMLF